MIKATQPTTVFLPHYEQQTAYHVVLDVVDDRGGFRRTLAAASLPTKHRCVHASSAGRVVACPPQHRWRRLLHYPFAM